MKQSHLRHLALQQYGLITKIENEVRKSIRKTLIDIKAQVLNQGRLFVIKSKDLRNLQDTLREAMILSYLSGQSIVRSQASNRSIKFSALSNAIKKFKRVTPQQLSQLNNIYDAEAVKVVTQLTTRLNVAARTSLALATQRGYNVTSATDALAIALDKSGVSPTNSYYVENITRTYTQTAFNAARWNEYQEEDIADILWGYTYITVGDDRVRDEHVALDGTTLPKDHPFWLKAWPPNGWSCRCQAVPVFEKVRIKSPPKDYQIDKGFDFNPGELVTLLKV